MKIAMLVGYAVIAVLGAVYTGSAIGTWAFGLLAILAVAHVIEVAVFYKRCQQAGGSMAYHVISVFLFGVVHIRELKQPG